MRILRSHETRARNFIIIIKNAFIIKNALYIESSYALQG